MLQAPHLIPGVVACVAAILLCFVASRQRRGERMHTNEVGPGAWLKLTQDKTRQDEPQVSSGSSCSASLRQWSSHQLRQWMNVYRTLGQWVGLVLALRLYLTRSYRAGFEHWEVP